MHAMADRPAEISRIYERLDALHQKTGLTFDCINTIIRAKCVVLDHRLRYDEAFELTKQLISKWETSQWRMKELTERYVKLLGNFLVFISRTNTYSEITSLINKMEAIETTEKEVAKDVFYMLSFCKVLNHIMQKQYKESLSTIPEAQKGLKEYSALLTFVQKRTLYTNICLIYFKNKMYPDVLDAIQDVYALVGRGKEKQHRIEDIRIYEFIAHYELGNTELLHYTIRNNQRFFKEHQPENDFIDHMWRLLKQLMQDTDKPKAAKQKLKTALELLPCPEVNLALKKELIEWLDGGQG